MKVRKIVKWIFSDQQNDKVIANLFTEDTD